MTDSFSRLVAALQQLVAGDRSDVAGVNITERAVLKKFNGDISGLSDEEVDKLTPEEVIVTEEGRIVDRWYRGEKRAVPE